jgi:hypothetical protein
MKRCRFIVFCIAIVVVSSVCGCISHVPILPKYLPVDKRDGRFFCYTRDFVNGNGYQVCFFRQPLEVLMPGGNGQWGITPVQLVVGVFVGVPLALADWFIASPIVDTVLLPYDIKYNFQSNDMGESSHIQHPKNTQIQGGPQ